MQGGRRWELVTGEKRSIVPRVEESLKGLHEKFDRHIDDAKRNGSGGNGNGVHIIIGKRSLAFLASGPVAVLLAWLHTQGVF